MIYTQMTMKAMKIAYNAHQGQVDQAGMPYIFHPFYLALQMDDEISCTVALLHDVVEDTDITLDELKQEFPESVISALTLLTHTKDVEYFEYVKKIKSNPIAKKVKLADIEHNSNNDRLIGIEISEEKLEYWKNKYAKAKAILLE